MSELRERGREGGEEGERAKEGVEEVEGEKGKTGIIAEESEVARRLEGSGGLPTGCSKGGVREEGALELRGSVARADT